MAHERVLMTGDEVAAVKGRRRGPGASHCKREVIYGK